MTLFVNYTARERERETIFPNLGPPEKISIKLLTYYFRARSPNDFFCITTKLSSLIWKHLSTKLHEEKSVMSIK